MLGLGFSCLFGLVFLALFSALPAFFVWRLTRWIRRSRAISRLAAGEGSRWEKLAWPFVQSGPIALPLFAADDGRGALRARNLVLAADGSAILDYETSWSVPAVTMPGELPRYGTRRWLTTIAVFPTGRPIAAFQTDPEPGWHAQGGGGWLILFRDRQVDPSELDAYRARAKQLAAMLLARL